MSCEKYNDNVKKCSCTYSGCSRHGRCCECIEYHLSCEELPACCFPAEVEKTYNRSFNAFIKCRQSQR